MSYTLTITVPTLDALAETVKVLQGVPAADTEVVAKPAKAKATKKVEEEAKAPFVEKTGTTGTSSSAPETVEVTFTQVKNVVLSVAKKYGREASLDLLVPFGVVTGEGKDRAGDMAKLKPEQYAAVVEAAEAKLGEFALVAKE